MIDIYITVAYGLGCFLVGIWTDKLLFQPKQYKDNFKLSDYYDLTAKEKN